MQPLYLQDGANLKEKLIKEKDKMIQNLLKQQHLINTSMNYWGLIINKSHVFLLITE